MPRAIGLFYDVGDPDDDTGYQQVDDTGGFMESLTGIGAQVAALIGGKGGGNIGETLGGLAGGALGTLAGGAGGAIGGNLGRMAGGAIENAVRKPPKKKRPAPPPGKKPPTAAARPAPKKPPPPRIQMPMLPPPGPAKRQRVPTKRERKILVDAQAMAIRTGEQGYLDEAKLRVFHPAEYKRRRDAGMLWSQNREEELGDFETPAEFDEQAAPEYDEQDEYNETAAPDPRPRPIRHLSATPFSEAQIETLVRAVPLLRQVDPRVLRLLSGSVGVARDVSGVDPTTGTYHALPGETPHGITKKLTGQIDRTQELLVANPGKPESVNVWNIPPGWLQYAKETGANLITARKYVVIKDDWPQKIAQKIGAFPARPKWWSELKAVNPHKATQAGTGNWESLYAGEEIGIPNEWPESSFAIPVSATPSKSDIPGLPGPGKNVTLDPALVPQSQALLMRWAAAHPNECNPSDYGRNSMDLVSGFTPRATQALASFQTWWNKKQPTRMLPATSGELDKPSYDALVETNNSENPVPWFPQQQQQQPPPNQQQQPQQQQPPPQQQQPPNQQQPQQQQPPPQPQLESTQIMQTQTLLGRWALAHPHDCNPPDYGRNMVDFVSGFTPRFTQALASFQFWWNKQQPNRTLPTTSGTLDKATYDALVETTQTEISQLPGLPSSQQQQQPSGGGGSNTTAQQSQGQPSQTTSSGSFIPGFQLDEKTGALVVTYGGKAYTMTPAAQSSSPPSGNTSSTPTPSPTQYDAGMSEQDRDKLLKALKYGMYAKELERMADDYEEKGYPLAATALRTQAAVKRAAGAIEPPSYEDPYEYEKTSDDPPYQPPPPPPTTSTTKNDSLVPLIAAIGVGLAFSS